MRGGSGPGARRRRWSELSGGQRLAVVLIGAVQLALLGAAQWDLSRRPQEQINGPKPLWRLLTLINLVGPIAYFLAGRRR